MTQAGGAPPRSRSRETLLALQAQLLNSERLPREQLRAMQHRRLEQVLRHASQFLPFWRERFAAVGYDTALPFDAQRFSRIPLLTRADVQQAGSALHVVPLPPGHGQVRRVETSGSTGRPAAFLTSDIEQVHWHAFTLREHLWHRRESGAKLCAIRYLPQGGGNSSGWGVSTDSVVETGPGAALSIDTPIAEQLAWLAREQPNYLLSYASNIAALAQACLRAAHGLPGLRGVVSVSETVKPDLRQLVREAWGVGLVDMYSAKELGYIALQCPEHEHYHVQEENLLLELLDEQGQPCAPGEPGRVVLTTLHKFANPLIRYEIGDYAVAGEDGCSCGRTLRVLSSVLGRTRNMLRLPDGGQRWPLCDLVRLAQVPGILQYQYVQHSLRDIEVRLVVAQGWSRELEPKLVEVIHRRLGHPFNLQFNYLANIERSAAGKFEDFLCLV